MPIYYDHDKMEQVGLQLKQIIKSWSKVDHSEILGCPGFSVGDELFCLIVTDGIVLTEYDDKLQEEIREKFETKLFKPDEDPNIEGIKISMQDTHFTSILPYIEQSYRLVVLRD